MTGYDSRDQQLLINRALDDLIKAISETVIVNSPKLIELGGWVSSAFENGGKLLLCGNGGSAADSQHIAAEFINRFRLERNPLPAIALTTDTSVITSISNDYGFNYVFSKQIEALASPKDVVIGISTSGNSQNIIFAMDTARIKGAKTVAFTGKGGGKMPAHADLVITVSSSDTPRIQEVHIFIGHLLCDIVEQEMFGGKRHG
ncbi:D-sedoheptulose-7-phosphate isomerase [Dissulfurimicrobium hydrothermale]|uniref:D-sedoheptulose-7-phosphate isomerase n=1 Tax=Dissulfurimicrobium hydrothermale TaxID=1750598 RepID=UPI001EDB9170|nr:D-sedoheptulose 7-phosphate isomerase [Dissulfurimicrobium hydrothermale]UKL13496.1 D-sedoheptulose 7-phosphate isomerase [Dissulfurimicrobium hydrothermale]